MPCVSRRQEQNVRRWSGFWKNSIVGAVWPISSSTPARSATPFRPTIVSRRSTPSATAGCMAVLVDSSLWVHQLRRSGDPVKRDRVNALLQNGLAAWCPPVRLELWRGVANDVERRALRQYEATLADYE